jgi:hypothetical protein
MNDIELKSNLAVLKRALDARSKAESVARAFGDSVPTWTSSETELQYRARLASKYQPHSPAWRNVDLSRLGSDALNVAETHIYADALKRANDPSSVPPGTLREIVETDGAGRKISRFVGDPGVTWGQFKAIPRVVVSIGGGK